MKYDKKGELAKWVKLKLLSLITIGEKNIKNEKLMEMYLDGISKGRYDNPKFPLLTDEQRKIEKLYALDRYFTSKEKSFIIDYLLDCLINNEPLDCSTLGPNEYLQE